MIKHDPSYENVPALSTCCCRAAKSRDITARVSVGKPKSSAGRIGTDAALVVVTVVPSATTVG